MTTIKEVFWSDDWIITKIKRGYDKMVRIDAKRRHHKANEPNFFHEWCTEKYANGLSRDIYGKKINEMRAYNY